MTELDLAKAIRDGAESSPQRYENVWLFDVRITGTGTSYRQALDEYVYRPPEHFLTEEFVERCNGLPLIFLHPGESILNTQEYRDRAIGTVVLPYIKGDEVWGIAKVFDDDAAALMRTSHASTSPAVVFRDAGSTEAIELSDGSTVLVEGKPSYLDHLAICEEGVWDKGGEPTGVNLSGDNDVDENEKVPAWADALSKRFDDVCGRLDAIENKGGDKFGEEKKDDAEMLDARKDESEEKKEVGEAEKDGKEEAKAEVKAVVEGEKERKEEESAERKDESKERADAAQARENAELRKRIADMDNRLKSLHTPLSASDRDALSVAQSRADAVAQLFGDSVNPPLHGESPIDYRKRLAAKFLKHSKSLEGVRLDSLDGGAFDVVENQIYADAQRVALSPSNLQTDRLIPTVRRDSAGREITTFTGDMNSWMKHFKSPGAICSINRTHPKGD